MNKTFLTDHSARAKLRRMRSWAQFRFSSLLLLLALTGTPQFAQANFCDRALSTAIGLFLNSKPVNTIRLELDDGSEVTLNVAGRIGNGMVGEVWELADNPGIELPALPPGMKWVAKSPLRVKPVFGGGTFVYSRIIQKRDVLIDSRVNQNVAQIEQSSLFPQNPHWNKGKVPVIPILKAIHTQKGIVLFKPMLTSHVSLDKLALKFSNQIPEHIVQSVKNIFSFVQAIHEQVRAPGVGVLDHIGMGSHPVSLDVNSGNLAWIEDPVQLQFFGLKEPGVVLFELSEIPGNRFISPKMSERQFLEYVFGRTTGI